MCKELTNGIPVDSTPPMTEINTRPPPHDIMARTLQTGSWRLVAHRAVSKIPVPAVPSAGPVGAR